MDAQTKQAVFDELAALVAANLPEQGFVVTTDEGKLTVETAAPVNLDGRQMDSMNLLSVIIQKHHVGFYYMPVYIAPDAIKPSLSAPVAKMLKGKSCFHCKAPLDEAVAVELGELVGRGVSLYRERGWLGE